MAIFEHGGRELSSGQKFVKRSFDIVLSSVGLILFWWLILIAWIFAGIDTRSNGFFVQRRVGRRGKMFSLVKIKTMNTDQKINTTVTRRGDPRITRIGAFFRKSKIDELPQLWNVLTGDMSFVGPRPDVAGFADTLSGEDRLLLSVRPGITGPASLKYRDEEELLATQNDPEEYNRTVIWPDKVAINCDYVRNWCLYNDIKYIILTVLH